jgi:hypothetical protein
MARSGVRLARRFHECAANNAPAATKTPANVPISNAQTNGIDLRKILRIDCSRRNDR